jgi:cell volume regulation protein A
MDPITVLLALSLMAFVILLGFFGDLIFKKTNIPTVLWLMGFGLVLGPISAAFSPTGSAIVDPSLFIEISPFFAALAIIVIIFDGGIYMDIYKIFREFPRGTMLAVSCFFFTVLLTTIIMMIFQYSLISGILMGAIIGGTSSAIVIPVVSKLKGISESTKTVLSLESALTDVLCIVVAIAVINAALVGVNVVLGVQSLVGAFSIGAAMGLFTGLIWLPIMRKLLEFEFSYVVTLAILFLLYASAEILQGSGAIACLLFGIVLANGRKIFSMIKYENMAFQMDATTKQFHSLMAFLIRTFFFVYLGLVVTIQNISFIMFGVVLVITVFAARNLGVLVANFKAEIRVKEQRVMQVMGARGLAAAVLAYLPISMGLAGTDGFADIVFTVIIGTVIVSTIGIMIVDRKYPSEPVKEQKQKVKKDNSKKVIEKQKKEEEVVTE